METKQKVISVNSVQFSDVFTSNSAKSHTEPFPTDVLLAETFAWRFPLSANTRMSTGRESDHIQVVQVSFIRLLGCCCSFMQYFFDMCLDITTIHAFHLFQGIYFDTWYYVNIVFYLFSNICYHVVSRFNADQLVQCFILNPAFIISISCIFTEKSTNHRTNKDKQSHLLNKTTINPAVPESWNCQKILNLDIFILGDFRYSGLSST